MSYEYKYLKYKNKYLKLKNRSTLMQIGGSRAGGAIEPSPEIKEQANLIYDNSIRNGKSPEEAHRLATLVWKGQYSMNDRLESSSKLQQQSSKPLEMPSEAVSALGNSFFARACGLAARGGWNEIEGVSALCRQARDSPERMQGVRAEPHHEGRTRLEFHTKAGNPGTVAQLMDEGGEEAVKEWTDPPYLKPVWRDKLFSHVTANEGYQMRPGWTPEDHTAALAVMKERAQERRPRGVPQLTFPDEYYKEFDFGPKIKKPMFPPNPNFLAEWRAANPHVTRANLEGNFTDNELVHLRGLQAVSIAYCTGITDAGFVHLQGVSVLDITEGSIESRYNTRYPGNYTDAALSNLRGIHTLIMNGQCNFTDAGFANLVGINTLEMGGCLGLTDVALSHLHGIKKLNVSCYATIYGDVLGPRITDAGLVHLRGIHTLFAINQNGITDAGLVHLRGIHTLDISLYSEYTEPHITEVGIAHLVGIYRLNVSGNYIGDIEAVKRIGHTVIVN
jgi:hypothetical protein